MSTINQLPSMATLIQGLIRDGQINLNETDDTNCSICTEPLISNSQPNENGIVVRMPPCHHLFHHQCILGSFNSTSPTRNLCPNCRAPLCELNVLSPDQEASRQADEAERNNAMADFNTAAYAWIMTLTDYAFNVQWNQFRPTEREDYIRIVSEVRTYWTREQASDFRVCYEHVVMGWDWFEQVVAQRVEARLREYPGAANTARARLFLGYLGAMTANVNEIYFAQGDGEVWSEDEEEEEEDEIEDEEDDENKDEEEDEDNDENDDNDSDEDEENDGNGEAEGHDNNNNDDDNDDGEDEDEDEDEPIEKEPVRRGIRLDITRAPNPPSSGNGDEDRDEAQRLDAESRSQTPSSPAIEVERRVVRTNGPRSVSPATRARLGINDFRPMNPLPNPIPHRRSVAPVPLDEPSSASADSSASSDSSDSDSDAIQSPSSRSSPPRFTPSTSLAIRPRNILSTRNRIAEIQRGRELRHYRQSHFARERRRLEREYDIIMELNDVGPLRPLGNMEFRVKNKADRVMGVVKNAVGFSYIGDSAVFYRLKV